jgi:hypothetical protein
VLLLLRGLSRLSQGRVERVVTPAKNYQTGKDSSPPPEKLVGGFIVLGRSATQAKRAAGIDIDG